MARKETGIARARRLMREQKCHVCEGQNPHMTVQLGRGKYKHYHVECR